MDYLVRWSELELELALDDVDEIAEYIHRDSPFYASIVVEKIKHSTSYMAAQLWSGRMVPEAHSEHLREIFIYDYRLIYEVLEEENTLVVLAVFHGKRDVNLALSSRFRADIE